MKPRAAMQQEPHQKKISECTLIKTKSRKSLKHEPWLKSHSTLMFFRSIKQ